MITPMRLAVAVAVAVAALGCAAAAPHIAGAAVATAVDPLPAAQASLWRSDSDSCSYIAAPGYVHGNGGGQVIQDNGHAYMGCGDGPTISLDDIGGDSATFSLHGDRVRVREGATERLGPYRVHVIDVRGQRVELELNDPD
jgi:hypothetical protein